MNILNHLKLSKGSNSRFKLGLLLVFAGLVLFLDTYINSGWLSFSILPICGLLIFAWGVYKRETSFVLVGSVIGGVGAGLWSTLGTNTQPSSFLNHIGLFVFYSGLGWFFGFMTSLLIRKPIWWTTIPAGALVGLGYSMAFSQMNWLNLVLFIGLGAGLSLLTWGLAKRLIGLVIPGCLLITTCPGIYVAWSNPVTGNSLAQTGIMLVWFAFGWALITLSGRYLVHQFIWWPLIPGGILAMVGCGLYIGGDPDSALNFISNTGSIGLMIFGLYLMLMRKGIHH
jgi:hypothetical protein